MRSARRPRRPCRRDVCLDAAHSRACCRDRRGLGSAAVEVRLDGRRPIAHQTRFWSRSCRGRLVSPVSFAQWIRSSPRVLRRWRGSRSGSWVPAPPAACATGLDRAPKPSPVPGPSLRRGSWPSTAASPGSRDHEIRPTPWTAAGRPSPRPKRRASAETPVGGRCRVFRGSRRFPACPVALGTRCGPGRVRPARIGTV